MLQLAQLSHSKCSWVYSSSGLSVCTASLHPGFLPQAPVTLIRSKRWLMENGGMKKSPVSSRWHSTAGSRLCYSCSDMTGGHTLRGGGSSSTGNDTVWMKLAKIETEIHFSPCSSLSGYRMLSLECCSSGWRHLMNPGSSLLHLKQVCIFSSSAYWAGTAAQPKCIFYYSTKYKYNSL